LPVCTCTHGCACEYISVHMCACECMCVHAPSMATLMYTSSRRAFSPVVRLVLPYTTGVSRASRASRGSRVSRASKVSSVSRFSRVSGVCVCVRV
jgi:hypothetical protein